MRFSKQREAVYSVLYNTDTHPDVSWIYAKAREIIPNISLGTVYRNLNELIELGKVKRVSAEGAAERFDAKVHEHAHLVCPHCGKISDLNASEVNLQHNVQGVSRAEITLYGICDDCRKRSDI